MAANEVIALFARRHAEQARTDEARREAMAKAAEQRNLEIAERLLRRYGYVKDEATGGYYKPEC